MDLGPLRFWVRAFEVLGLGVWGLGFRGFKVRSVGDLDIEIFLDPALPVLINCCVIKF